MPNEVLITQQVILNFANWGLTNFKEDYRHLAAPGKQPVVNNGAKNADARLHMMCQAFRGNRKSTDEVMRTGMQAFQNGAGCCTTSAFAVAYKLHDAGVTDRIEIIGQGSFDNGHMWVVVGRTNGTEHSGGLVKGRKRPDNSHNHWGDYMVVDVWLKAFGWKGVWRTPPQGKHHFFIDNEFSKLEVTYDSLVGDGD